VQAQGTPKLRTYKYTFIMKIAIMAPDRVFLNSDAKEIILPTNTGQIGILENHTPLISALDIGVMLLREEASWSSLVIMGGFALVQQKSVTILVNEVELGKNIDADKAKSEFDEAQAFFNQAQGKKDEIEGSLALKRARARYQAQAAVQN
jgi:ATP synthase F1 epsilon subunit